MPLVYVIVLNWNGWKDAIPCAESIRASSYPNFRVLVVDNGSTDDSVPRIKAAIPNMEVLETGKNLGFAGGNNLGIKYALEKKADYVWLINNDTLVDSGALSALVTAAEADSSVGAVGSVICYMDRPEKIQVWGGGRFNIWLGISRHYLSPVADKQLHYLTGASLLLSTRALREIGLLDERFFMYWEDVDLGVRLRAGGWSLTVARDSKVLHKEAGSLGRRNPLTETYSNASYVKFCRRHAPIPLISILVGVGIRLVHRVWLRDWTRVRAVVRGAYLGCQGG